MQVTETYVPGREETQQTFRVNQAKFLASWDGLLGTREKQVRDRENLEADKGSSNLHMRTSRRKAVA